MELLTPKAIAYWFMDDGSRKDNKTKAVRLCTDSFTLKEVQFLCDVLLEKYEITSHPYLNRAPDQYRIYVDANGYDNFKNLVFPYILPGFQYKLSL